jgi:hypothetical protein
MNMPYNLNLVGGSELTNEDLDNISAFALRLQGSGLSRSTYHNLRRFFRHKLSLDTEYLMYRRMEILSGVKPTFYDMCSASCCLFVGPFAEHIQCSFCLRSRHHFNGKPIARFSYLPVIPRIQGWFGNEAMIRQLQYRSHRESIPEQISDVFDGSHYQKLLNTYVSIDGTDLEHKYFSDHRDIALGGSTDGFQVSESTTS